jgi:hypothetical protein
VSSLGDALAAENCPAVTVKNVKELLSWVSCWELPANEDKSCRTPLLKNLYRSSHYHATTNADELRRLTVCYSEL